MRQWYAAKGYHQAAVLINPPLTGRGQGGFVQLQGGLKHHGPIASNPISPDKRRKLTKDGLCVRLKLSSEDYQPIAKCSVSVAASSCLQDHPMSLATGEF